MEQLDRDGPSQFFVEAVQHHAQPAAAQLLQDAVVPERAQVPLDRGRPQRDSEVLRLGRDLAVPGVALETLDQSRQPWLMLEGGRRCGPLGIARRGPGRLWPGRERRGMRHSPSGERAWPPRPRASGSRRVDHQAVLRLGMRASDEALWAGDGAGLGNKRSFVESDKRRKIFGQHQDLGAKLFQDA